MRKGKRIFSGVLVGVFMFLMTGSYVTANVDTEIKSDTAVLYFSGTGNTEKVAETLASVLEADLYQIIPEQEYTEDDLNYRDDNCRANQEMQNEDVRPEIKNDLSDVAKHKNLYLGYPIWWGTAPRIIQTFLESYELQDTDIYLFCTSGGSGIEQSVEDLQSLYPELNIISGKRFATGDKEETLRSWVEEITDQSTKENE